MPLPQRHLDQLLPSPNASLTPTRPTIQGTDGASSNWLPICQLQVLQKYSKAHSKHAKIKAISFCANQRTPVIEAISSHPCQQAAAPTTTNCRPSFPARSHFGTLGPIFKRTSLSTRKYSTNLQPFDLHNARSIVASLRLCLITTAATTPDNGAVGHYLRTSPTFSLQPRAIDCAQITQLLHSYYGCTQILQSHLVIAGSSKSRNKIAPAHASLRALRDL